MKWTGTYLETTTYFAKSLRKNLRCQKKVGGVDGTLGSCLLCMPTEFSASECTLVRFLFCISKLHVRSCILAGMDVRGSAGWSLIHAQYSTGKHLVRPSIMP
jgi:hypothetical protein